jgi:signal transduction histidine kinase
MTDGVASDENRFLLASLSPTPTQQRTALVVAVLFILAFGLAAPFAHIQLRQIEVFIPATQGVLCANNLFTAVLLYSQFSMARTSALLVLATGYLFAALILVPHALTFPGAFSTSGLLGAGENSAPWLYMFWHAGFVSAVLAYAILRENDAGPEVHTRRTISGSVMAVLILVVSLTWLSTAGIHHLPQLTTGNARTHLPYYLSALDLAVGLAALAMLRRARRSLLDLWLSVVVLALVLEVLLSVFLTTDGFHLGFYVGRLYALATSLILLIALIAETMRLEARLAQSNVMLQRERNNRLISATAVAASISQEVRQPLMSIAMNGDAAARFLAKTPPDYEEVKAALDAVVKDSQRTSQIFESIGSLFRGNGRVQQPLDLNEVVREALQLLESDLHDNGVEITAELTPRLPKIIGHPSQLQEVVINLVTNAIEAMAANPEHTRFLQVKTEPYQDGVAVTVTDTGPGIPADKMSRLFDAFITSKGGAMGLGLAICRMIIERHGGQLWATSGDGAAFRFILPGQAPQNAQTDHTSPNRP